jgi:hypothetical protein
MRPGKTSWVVLLLGMGRHGPIGTRATSCSGRCGMQTSVCWCDDACHSHGDCCSDVVAACAVPGVQVSCEQHCGLRRGTCWCDPLCRVNSDCCRDYVAVCAPMPNTASTASAVVAFTPVPSYEPVTSGVFAAVAVPPPTYPTNPTATPEVGCSHGQ